MISKKTVTTLLQSLPLNPGVYIMYDQADQVIYVGKAKSLKDRVSSYFLQTNSDYIKTAAIRTHIVRLDYIITDTEHEALILESNLIKKYLPRFNVLLKDDKHYPYIKIDMTETFPSIQVVRKKLNDNARYFGPFPQSSIIKPSLKFMTKYFPIRTCSGDINKRHGCLNFHIKRCLGPCLGGVDGQQYQQYVREVIFFLEGKYERLKAEIESQMKHFASNQHYEQAQVYRDRLYSLQKITQRQKIILDGAINIDVLAFFHDAGILYICIMVYRDGYLLNQHNYKINMPDLTSQEETICEGLIQHYLIQKNYPDEILLPGDYKEHKDFLAQLIAALPPTVTLKFPMIGEKRDLLEMAAKNVTKFTQNSGFLPRYQKESELLKLALGLHETPVSVLGFDISHLSGTNTVASAVYFEYGKPKKIFYKRFTIKSVDESPDDYKSMHEVISRYFSKFPGADVIVIDGGKGQLKAALNAIGDLKVNHKIIIGLAKKKEEIYLPGMQDPILLPLSSPALHLLQRVRDEAHRFAITFQKQKRKKTALRSKVEDIPGISLQRKRKLLFYFGSVESIKKATVGDIINVPGFGTKLAQKIYNALH